MLHKTHPGYSDRGAFYVSLIALFFFHFFFGIFKYFLEGFKSLWKIKVYYVRKIYRIFFSWELTIWDTTFFILSSCSGVWIACRKTSDSLQSLLYLSLPENLQLQPEASHTTAGCPEEPAGNTVRFCLILFI